MFRPGAAENHNKFALRFAGERSPKLIEAAAILWVVKLRLLPFQDRGAGQLSKEKPENRPEQSPTWQRHRDSFPNGPASAVIKLNKKKSKSKMRIRIKKRIKSKMRSRTPPDV